MRYALTQSLALMWDVDARSGYMEAVEELLDIVDNQEGQIQQFKKTINGLQLHHGSGYPDYPWKCIGDNGYVMLYDYDNDDFKVISEHRYLMRTKYGEDAIKDKDVHHINECKLDNDPTNLEILTRSEHVQKHVNMRR